MNYLLLLYEFLKTGLFSIGGGLATMPFLYSMADKYPWFTRELLLDMIAVSESTPGPIGINMATYAGFMAGGIPGGVLATLAIIFPSILIMTVIVRVLDRFRENHYVTGAFYGLRPAVTALIASAGIGVAGLTLFGSETFEIKKLLLFVLLLLAMRFIKKMQPIYIITAAAAIGAVLKF